MTKSEAESSDAGVQTRDLQYNAAGIWPSPVRLCLRCTGMAFHSTAVDVTPMGVRKSTLWEQIDGSMSPDCVAIAWTQRNDEKKLSPLCVYIAQCVSR